MLIIKYIKINALIYHEYTNDPSVTNFYPFISHKTEITECKLQRDMKIKYIDIADI